MADPWLDMRRVFKDSEFIASTKTYRDKPDSLKPEDAKKTIRETSGAAEPIC